MTMLMDPPEPTAEEQHRWDRDTWKRFAIRTVKDGRVTIKGRQYEPDANHMEYDGRLDGMRFAFGLYHGRPDLVSLWGTEAAYWAVDDDAKFEELWNSAPECVDGS
jgi:hypothetical protein